MQATACILDAKPQLQQLDLPQLHTDHAQWPVQVQQEALTEEEVALLQPVQAVQICLQPQPDTVLCMPLHSSASRNICML